MVLPPTPSLMAFFVFTWCAPHILAVEPTLWCCLPSLLHLPSVLLIIYALDYFFSLFLLLSEYYLFILDYSVFICFFFFSLIFFYQPIQLFLCPLLKPSPHTNNDFYLVFLFSRNVILCYTLITSVLLLLGFPLQQEFYLLLNVDHSLFIKL